MATTRSRSSADDLRLRALAEIERRKRLASPDTNPFDAYRYDPESYIHDKLGWEPWAGDAEHPGQSEVIAAYVLALRQQHERSAYEAGELAEPDLHFWKPDQTIKNRLRIEAGHTVGKTKLASGLVNHFFDCFTPSIIYTFAPSWEQIHDLLWKEIKADRRGKGLPGRVLDLALDVAPDHFAKGRATNDSGGKGTERAQGQHGKYLMFVLDEAEGIANFVYDAVDSMTSGGISIVLLLANPKTRASRFYKVRNLSHTRNFRISCVYHPNVLAGREVVPGAVKRQYVESMLEAHAETADQHAADDYTFEVPWRPGVIYKPDPEFLFRVLGIAPANLADNTFVPFGRYEAACQRPVASDRPTMARLGVDVARFGKDFGTVYVRHDGKAWRAAQLYHQDTTEYAKRIVAAALPLAAKGVTSLHVRVDGGGGFGGGVIDQVKRDLELIKAFPDFRVLEVHFNGTPHTPDAYADLITEMYGEAAKALVAVRVDRAPDELQADLCERLYGWYTAKGIAVKRLEPKEKFRERVGRSPDDGDGFCLATAPDHIFGPAKPFGWMDAPDPAAIADPLPPELKPHPKPMSWVRDLPEI